MKAPLNPLCNCTFSIHAQYTQIWFATNRLPGNLNINFKQVYKSYMAFQQLLYNCFDTKKEL